MEKLDNIQALAKKTKLFLILHIVFMAAAPLFLIIAPIFALLRAAGYVFLVFTIKYSIELMNATTSLGEEKDKLDEEQLALVEKNKKFAVVAFIVPLVF